MHGPVISDGVSRWLLQGRDLTRVKVAMRPVVQAWREAKAKVRVDVDPVDL